MTKVISAVVVGVLVGSLSLIAQGQGVDLNKQIESMKALPTSNADYRLGPGDLIEIRVFGVSGYDHNLRISAGGTIKLPLLDPVVAVGLSAAGLEQKLAALLHVDVIKNPQVSVFVKEYRSQPVTVLGAVRSPGQFQIMSQLRIVDVLSMAGGLQPNASDEAMIQRASTTGADEIIRVDLRQLLERGDLTLNTVVRGGDVINVKPREEQFVSVVGELTRPAVYPLPARQDVRISQVFAWAGGGAKTAKLSQSLLIRYDAAGQRQEIKLDLSEILKGKQEDIFVRAQDIIFVPGSRIKLFTNTLLSGLPNAVGTIPYRIP